MNKFVQLLLVILLGLVAARGTSAQHALHETSPPDAQANYATLGFCGFSSVSIDGLQDYVDSGEAAAEIVDLARLLRSKSGVVVIDVRSGSAADTSGLKSFDLLTTVNGVKVSTPTEASAEFAKVKPPASAKCRVMRVEKRRNRMKLKLYKVDLPTTSYLTYCVLATDAYRDEVDNTTLLSHKDQPSRWTSSFVSLQAVQIKDSPSVLRLKFNYAGDDWLFVESVSLVTKDERLDFSTKSPTRENDIIAGKNRLHEQESFVLDTKQVSQLRTIIADRQTGTLRFSGKTYKKDVEFDRESLHRMEAVFDRWAISVAKPTIFEFPAPPEPADGQQDQQANDTTAEATRTFRDVTGKFSVEAFFVKLEDDMLTCLLYTSPSPRD